MVLQFGMWYWALSRKFKKEEIVEDDVEQSLPRERTHLNPVFEVETTLMQYTQAVET